MHLHDKKKYLSNCYAIVKRQWKAQQRYLSSKLSGELNPNIMNTSINLVEMIYHRLRALMYIYNHKHRSFPTCVGTDISN